MPEKVIISIPKDSDAQIALAGIELAKITGNKYNIFNIPTSSATTEPFEGYPTATCEDADNETVVIMFQESPVTGVAAGNERCIVISYAEREEAVMASDLLAYNLLKIM